MNLDDLPAYQPDIEKLKNDLKSFCEQFSIAKFEPEDIIELLEDGEEVGWIIDQLKTENSEIDVDALTGMLTDIRSVVAPPAEADEEEEVDVEDEADSIVEDAPEKGMPDLSQLDISQLSLPPGFKLPPGFDMKQLEQLMQSPQGEFLTDFTLFCQEKGMEDLPTQMSDPAALQQLNEEWMVTPREAFDGRTPAEMLDENPALMPQKAETYRREEPRVGRNDPCPCGRGKKYKKCCGKGQ